MRTVRAAAARGLRTSRSCIAGRHAAAATRGTNVIAPNVVQRGHTATLLLTRTVAAAAVLCTDHACNINISRFREGAASNAVAPAAAAKVAVAVGAAVGAPAVGAPAVSALLRSTVGGAASGTSSSGAVSMGMVTLAVAARMATTVTVFAAEVIVTLTTLIVSILAVAAVLVMPHRQHSVVEAGAAHLGRTRARG